MGSLSSSSTLANAWDQYRDNAAYDVDNSVAKVKLFIEACRFIVEAKPDQAGTGSTMQRGEVSRVEKQLDDALKWWKANDSTATTSVASVVRGYSTEYFRD